MLKKLRAKKKKGFTLVELIVVIAILMILSVVAVASYGSIQTEAEIASLRADAGSLVQMLEAVNAFSDTQITTMPQVAGGAAPASLTSLAVDTTTGTFTINYSVNGVGKTAMTVRMPVENSDDCDVAVAATDADADGAINFIAGQGWHIVEGNLAGLVAAR